MLFLTILLLAVLGIVLAVYGGVLTSDKPLHRKAFVGLGIFGVLLAIAQAYFLKVDDREKSKTATDLRDSIKNLQDQASSLMNAIQLQATLGDFKHLESLIGEDFAHLEQSVKGTKHAQIPPPEKTPQLPAAIVEHVRIVQRRAASNDSAAPYGLQVVMQTDVTIQPVAFRVEFDQEIVAANVFIVGEGAYIMKATAFSSDHKSFMFSFHSPAFTPNSSLVVGVDSKYDVRVVKVEKIQPIF
jgi:hypothetical protein